MKNTNISSLSCFLLLAILLAIHSPWPSVAYVDECHKYLCDDTWEFVKAGERYHLGPPLETQGGEISLENTTPNNDEEDPCPRQAVVLRSRSTSKINGGFIFKPIVPEEDGRVPLAAAIAISSPDEELECEEETGVLQMKRRSNELSFWHITADGTANTAASCFQFLRYTQPSDPENTKSYFLQNCPYMCGTGTIGYCQSVGSVNKTSNGTWNIYLTSTTKQPFEFKIWSDWGTDSAARIKKVTS